MSIYRFRRPTSCYIFIYLKVLTPCHSFFLVKVISDIYQNDPFSTSRLLISLYYYHYFYSFCLFLSLSSDIVLEDTFRLSYFSLFNKTFFNIIFHLLSLCKYTCRHYYVVMLRFQRPIKQLSVRVHKCMFVWITLFDS